MKSLIKRFVPEDSFLYKVNRKRFFYFKKLTNYKPWYPSRWEYDVLAAYAGLKMNVKFIQVGSNNGIDGDPINQYIRRNSWQGILVEPVPHLFEKLKLNYSAFQDKLFFENSAVGTENGKLKFYRLDRNGTDAPEKLDQLGSFKKEVVLKHRHTYPGFENLIVEDTVNTITFCDLLKKHSVVELNLVHIDTEGFDYEIIKMIPFSKLDIDFIMFEHAHLSESDFRGAVKLLRKNGFKVCTKDSMDTVAVKKPVLKSISTANA